MIRYILITYLFCIVVSCKKDKKNDFSFEPISIDTPYKFNQEITEKLSNDTVPWKDQVAASDFATKGEYKNAMEQWDDAMDVQPREIDKNKIDSILDKNRVVSAKGFILEEAKKHQITIINEAHHQPMHRVFTTTLLHRLFDSGYRYLGLETLNRKDSLLNQRKYPIMDSGSYTQEPQFGGLVREALEIGYTLFAYETEQMGNTTIENRETTQATNIKAFLENNDNGKILLHVGYAHASEGSLISHEKNQKWMASKLYDLTGINPFTINQEVYTEKSLLEKSSPLLQKLNPKKSIVLVDKLNAYPKRYERDKGWMDVAVFHPFTNYENGRPDWIFSNGKQKVEFTLNEKIQLEGPLMIFAFKKGEDIFKAVPVDIQEIENRNSPITLALKSGPYKIVVQNIHKKGVVFSFEVD